MLTVYVINIYVYMCEFVCLIELKDMLICYSKETEFGTATANPLCPYTNEAS